MTKFYRVKKDNFMWKEGAILSDGSKGEYRPIEDIWNQCVLKNEYISAHIIESEDNKDYFERVYPDTIKGNFYRTKDQLVDLYKKTFKGEE